MANSSCGREGDTIRAARGERPGPDVDPDLAVHLAECASCAEIAWMAAALRAERDAGCVEARPPSAGVVWWRAQRRAREEAARRASRPIALVHALALGCAGAASAALLGVGPGILGPLFEEWAFSWPALPTASAAVAALADLPLGLGLAFTAALLLAPVAIYLALSEK